MTRRKFERPTGWRKPRILFIISAEGEKTEPQYFQRFNNEQVTVILTAHLGGQGQHPAAGAQAYGEGTVPPGLAAWRRSLAGR